MTIHRRRTPALDDPHERYAAAGQSEPPLSAFLATTDHPLAGEYRAARARFDSLTWTCGFAQRVAFFADANNQVQLSAPQLTIGSDPRGWRGVSPVDLHDPESWRDYAEAAAAAGFPPATRPNGHLGSWTLVVHDAEAARRLRVVLRVRGLDWRPVNGRAEYRMFTGARSTAVEAAIREALLPGWELAPYTAPAPLTPPVAAAPGARRTPRAPGAEITLFDALFP